MSLGESTCVSQRRQTLKRLLIERRYSYEESSSFLRRDCRGGRRPGFSRLLYYSRDLSSAHHDASAGFASNPRRGLFHPGGDFRRRGPGNSTEICEKVVARATRGKGKTRLTSTEGWHQTMTPVTGACPSTWSHLLWCLPLPGKEAVASARLSKEITRREALPPVA